MSNDVLRNALRTGSPPQSYTGAIYIYISGGIPGVLSMLGGNHYFFPGNTPEYYFRRAYFQRNYIERNISYVLIDSLASSTHTNLMNFLQAICTVKLD